MNLPSCLFCLENKSVLHRPGKNEQDQLCQNFCSNVIHMQPLCKHIEDSGIECQNHQGKSCVFHGTFFPPVIVMENCPTIQFIIEGAGNETRQNIGGNQPFFTVQKQGEEFKNTKINQKTGNRGKPEFQNLPVDQDGIPERMNM
jgi:hypothetical protein